MGGRERESQRRGRVEEERGKRHRDLIAVQLSVKASGREQCSLRHSPRGRVGARERVREGRKAREREMEGKRECIYLGGLSEASLAFSVL